MPQSIAKTIEVKTNRKHKSTHTYIHVLSHLLQHLTAHNASVREPESTSPCSSHKIASSPTYDQFITEALSSWQASMQMCLLTAHQVLCTIQNGKYTSRKMTQDSMKAANTAVDRRSCLV
jgi:Ser-tRNA(Ala) deacylase AlaX